MRVVQNHVIVAAGRDAWSPTHSTGGPVPRGGGSRDVRVVWPGAAVRACAPTFHIAGRASFLLYRSAGWEVRREIRCFLFMLEVYNKIK